MAEFPEWYDGKHINEVMNEREFYELVERIFDLPEVKTLLPKAGE